MKRWNEKAAFILFVLAGTGAIPQISADEPAIGVYHWANGTPGVDSFAAWLDRPTVWGLDFVGGETWNNVQWPTWWLENWSKWKKEKPGRKLILSIPMLAGPPDRSGPTKGDIETGQPVSLEKGGRGDYNHHFKQLAENIVAYQLTDSILRPGWEFNGHWYAWKAKENPEAFAEYWRQMVTTMRAVPGCEKLQFCWNPTLDEQDFPFEKAWPGEQYVDFVGVDVYDHCWNPNTYPWPSGTSEADIESRQQKVWLEWTFYSPRGLKFWSEFAREKNKPLAIPEWGLVRSDDQHGGLDNPYFIEQMHAFINDPANRVAFHCYFDVNGSEGMDHQLSPGPANSTYKEGTQFPKSAARFKALFAGKRP